MAFFVVAGTAGEVNLWLERSSKEELARWRPLAAAPGRLREPPPPSSLHRATSSPEGTGFLLTIPQSLTDKRNHLSDLSLTEPRSLKANTKMK